MQCTYSLHFCVSLYNLPIYNIHISITSLPCLLFTNVFAPYWLYITALFSESVYLPPLVLSTTDVFPFPTSAPETTNYHYTAKKAPQWEHTTNKTYQHTYTAHNTLRLMIRNLVITNSDMNVFT